MTRHLSPPGAAARFRHRVRRCNVCVGRGTMTWNPEIAWAVADRNNATDTICGIVEYINLKWRNEMTRAQRARGGICWSSVKRMVTRFAWTGDPCADGRRLNGDEAVRLPRVLRGRPRGAADGDGDEATASKVLTAVWAFVNLRRSGNR